MSTRIIQVVLVGSPSIILIALLLTAGTAHSTTLLVPSQYPTIQEGINAAVSGDTVLVADGIYTGPGNKNLDFGGRAIVVTSENGPQSCVIDCENVGVGFTFHSFEWHDSVVSGFTITRASGNGAIVCIGDGIYDASPTISGNVLCRSTGEGIYCFWSYALITDNVIFANSGGVLCRSYMGPSLSRNTIAYNSGTGVYGFYPTGNASLSNCIVWRNSPDIYEYQAGSISANYCDIRQHWPGTGNINVYPAFVDTAQDDYRLQWGSPCIDSGNPGSPLDPDGTRADMGAFYYDQSMPVRVLLTAYHAPIQIRASGGSFQYAIQATNIDSVNLPVLIWCNATLPSGTIHDPVLGPVIIYLGSEQTISRLRTQNISAHSPAGMYHYNAFAVAAGDTSADSFVFWKLGAGGSNGLSGWHNSFGGGNTPTLQQNDFAVSASPNPFNVTSAICYQLTLDSQVDLEVFDISGRLVSTLVDGWREAGLHEVTFDGSELPSGLYFAKLKAGDFSQVQKLILLK